MSLYDLAEGMFELLGILYDTGAMTVEEEELFDKYEAIWYNFYEKDF